MPGRHGSKETLKQKWANRGAWISANQREGCWHCPLLSCTVAKAASRKIWRFGFPFPSSTAWLWKAVQSSWHCCVSSWASLDASNVSAHERDWQHQPESPELRAYSFCRQQQGGGYPWFSKGVTSPSVGTWDLWKQPLPCWKEPGNRLKLFALKARNVHVSACWIINISQPLCL